MNVLDLFSGVGGFSLGLERAGMRTVQFVEIDPYCQAVLRKHWPNVPIHGDVRTFDGRSVTADVVCGGFPCQDLSVAGKRAGLAGERSGLWFEYARIIGELRPRWVVIENVPGLLTHGFGTVIADLDALGYVGEWHCIPASAVGAPHRRDRVWIIAYADSAGCTRARPPQPEGWQRDPVALGRSAPMAHPLGAGLEVGPRLAGYLAEELAAVERGRQAVADAPSERLEGAQPQRGEHDFGAQPSNDGGAIPDPYGEPLGRLAEPRGQRGQWEPESRLGGMVDGFSHWIHEPDIGRVAQGVPNRVQRLRALGNAVVPMIPELIGRAIMRAAA